MGARVAGLRHVTVVYLLLACVMTVVAVVRGLILRSMFVVPGSDLFSEHFYVRFWWEWARLQVLLLALLPAFAGAATHWLPSAVDGPLVNGPRPAGPRLAAVAPWICVVGAGLIELELHGSGANSGWFNYAPNSGVTFSPGGELGRQLLGRSLVWTGLWITAVTLIATFGRPTDRRSRLLVFGSITLIVATTQVVVAVVAPLVVLRIWWDLWREPGLWGR
ncbi:hypothetical protein BH10ACT3_BH10ACT3_06150 [soil metagenome]